MKGYSLIFLLNSRYSDIRFRILIFAQTKPEILINVQDNILHIHSIKEKDKDIQNKEYIGGHAGLETKN